MILIWYFCCCLTNVCQTHLLSVQNFSLKEDVKQYKHNLKNKFDNWKRRQLKQKKKLKRQIISISSIADTSR